MSRPKPAIVDYQILYSSDRLALAGKVRDLLPEWTPLGSPIISATTGALIQAMVKYEESEE